MRPRSLLALVVIPTLFACAPRDDGYLLLRRRENRHDGERTPLRYARTDDATALAVRRLLADGFGAELLRTYAMARRLVGRGSDPAIIAIGNEDTFKGVPYREREFDGGWFKQVLPATTPVAWVDDEHDARPGLGQLTTGLGRAILDTVVGPQPSPVDQTLRDGYLAFLTVVAAEWQASDDEGARERDSLRALPTYAEIRANDAVWGKDREGDTSWSIRSGEWQMRDPEVVATVLYRMASSELGRRMAPAAIYGPFLASEPPHGIHPALLLGAFRNFQAKLFVAWRRAADHGDPDLIDLVESYAEAFPAERPEVTRIFLVTTYGATAQRHDVIRGPWEPGWDLDRALAALTADVLFGRVGLRDGLNR